MDYRFLADSVVIIHFCFILFVIFGAFFALKWKWVIWLHLPALCWGVSIGYWGWICPLTPLENWLRHSGGDLIYEGGFIAHYLLPMIYPEGLTQGHQMILGAALLVLNGVIYFALWVRQRGDNN